MSKLPCATASLCRSFCARAFPVCKTYSCVRLLCVKTSVRKRVCVQKRLCCPTCACKNFQHLCVKHHRTSSYIIMHHHASSCIITHHHAASCSIMHHHASCVIHHHIYFCIMFISSRLLPGCFFPVMPSFSVLSCIYVRAVDLCICLQGLLR